MAEFNIILTALSSIQRDSIPNVSLFVLGVRNVDNISVCMILTQKKQGVALTGRNRTGPSCSVGRPTAHAPGPAPANRPRSQRPARPPAALQTTTTTDDRRQRAKQYWPIRWASSKTNSPVFVLHGTCITFNFISFEFISVRWRQ